jgi:polysaccharide chain length determinant protein (PEP-CTERM system associated)
MDQEIYQPMDDEDYKGLADYLAILKRRKWQLILPSILILIVSGTLAYKLPAIYRSVATILIEQQQIPADLVRSTVTSYAGERIQVISQRVMTTENLGKIINEYGLYTEERKNQGLNNLVDRLRNNIKLDMVSAEARGKNSTGIIAFTISFTDENPRLAQKVTNELVSLYLNENLKRRTQSALETTGFLATEANRLEEQVEQLESQLAAFKQKNINNLPEHQQLTMQMMQRSESELAQTNQQIQTLQDRKIYVKTELAKLSPTQNSLGVSISDRINALEEEYEHLSIRYTDKHPTLIKIKQEIEALKQERTPVENKPHGDQQEPRDYTQTANPIYHQLQDQLNKTEGELAGLERAKEKLVAKIKDFEQRLMQGPQVEREYRILSRDYENALAKLKEIKAKLLEAELAESLERESKGERFSLIEPPQVPQKPIKPNRMAILLLGFVFSFAGGVGHVIIRESIDQTIHGSKDVIMITKTPPLAVIPYIQNRQDKAKVTARLATLFAVIFVVIVVGIAFVHFYYQPLDVLWYVFLRKLGLDAGA